MASKHEKIQDYCSLESFSVSHRLEIKTGTIQMFEVAVQLGPLDIDRIFLVRQTVTYSSAGGHKSTNHPTILPCYLSLAIF